MIDETTPAESPHFFAEAIEAFTTIFDAMYSYWLPHNIDFSEGTEELEENRDESLVGAVHFVLAVPPYSIARGT